MAQRTTLTEAQVSLLRWIGDGCPAAQPVGEYHRISAAALRRRNLITTTGRGDRWSAAITEAGRAYLAEVDGPSPPEARQANVSVTEQLIADLLASDGALEVPTKTWTPRTRSTASTALGWRSFTTRCRRAFG